MLRVFKITGKTCGKIIYLPILWVQLKKSSTKDLSNDAYPMFFVLLFFFLIFFIKTYVVGTHLNCINKSMQFRWVPTIYAFIKK